MRRDFLLAAPTVLGAATAIPALSRTVPVPFGRYAVSMLSVDPPRFSVIADLPIDGDRLVMSESYPAELPEMAAGGWPSLITGLTVSGANGGPIDLIRIKNQGWRLAHPASGRIQVRYIVDFALFAQAGWPSPRESAVADHEHIAVSARALFLTTDKLKAANVSFNLPGRWRAAAPWPTSARARDTFQASSTQDLTDNFIVFSTRPPDVVIASGFRMQISTMGDWRPLRPSIRTALQAIVSGEVALMGYKQREAYNVVLVPAEDTGGEAYRQSFVYSYNNPTVANRGAWANTMAHEIFHYWNSARLKGADYASSQWFQEGFTEYVANLTVVGGGIITPDAFLAKLGTHVANYGRLKTTLEAIGTQKGPPLYSAGALVAFTFDVMMRKATAGRSNIGTFFRNLWLYTNAGNRKYGWSDIEASLRGAAELDWRGYYERHIRGHDPLPLEQAFHDAGLLLQTGSDGSPVVVIDPTADVSRTVLWKRLISTK